jgi:hypothetical protein
VPLHHCVSNVSNYRSSFSAVLIATRADRSLVSVPQFRTLPYVTRTQSIIASHAAICAAVCSPDINAVLSSHAASKNVVRET